ncbi:MAG: YciI family protein [Ramlibacter sp.]
MKYLCLAFYNPEQYAAMAPDDVQAMVSQCPGKDAQLKATGRLHMHGSLGGAGAAFNLRPRGGKPQLTDGPFTESKEIVGGFFMIEAADRDEAVRLASLHPAATLGEQAGWGIELHPVGFFEQFGVAA